MPARIRLQIKGHPANRFFWIVASSSKLNPHGRPIERMGYWFPDVKGVYDNRSIVLNRPRLKYWIGLGAQITSGAYRVLSQANFLPKKPPPFGLSTLYEHPGFIPTPEPPKPPERDLGAAEDLRDQIEEIEKQNLLRKESYVENAHRQFHIRDSKPAEEEIREYMQKYYYYLEKLKQLAPSDTKSKAEAFLNMLDTANETFTKDRYINARTIAEKLNIPLAKAEKVVQMYESVGQEFEQADLDDFKVDMSRKRRPKKFKPGAKVYVPSENPITPYPNFEDDNDVFPKDFHGIRNPLRPAKEYGAWIEPDKSFESDRDFRKPKSNRRMSLFGLARSTSFKDRVKNKKR